MMMVYILTFKTFPHDIIKLERRFMQDGNKLWILGALYGLTNHDLDAPNLHLLLLLCPQVLGGPSLRKTDTPCFFCSLSSPSFEEKSSSTMWFVLALLIAIRRGFGWTKPRPARKL